MKPVSQLFLFYLLIGKLIVFRICFDLKSFLSLVYRRGIVCPTVSCDFEIDQCGWAMDTAWKVYPSGSTPDTATSGPTADHTTGCTSREYFQISLQTVLFPIHHLRWKLCSISCFTYRH